MFCMKCGAKIEEGRVFCQECLAVMNRYPVKPGAVVQLPARPAKAESRKTAPRKREVPVEKKLRRCRRAVAVLSFLLVVVTLALGLLIGSLYYQHNVQDPSETKGQNYTPIETTDVSSDVSRETN